MKPKAFLKRYTGEADLKASCFAMMVKHYSTAEIMQLARHLGTPEAQSALQKQQPVLSESMEFGAREFECIFEAATSWRNPPH